MKKREKIYQYEVIFDPNERGYTVVVPDLPGLITEGDNLKEARKMVKEAIRCHLEGLLKDKNIHPEFGSLIKERVNVLIK